MFRAHLGLNLPVHVPLNFQQHVTQDNEVEISPKKWDLCGRAGTDKMVYNWGRWVRRQKRYICQSSGWLFSPVRT